MTPYLLFSGAAFHTIRRSVLVFRPLGFASSRPPNLRSNQPSDQTTVEQWEIQFSTCALSLALQSMAEYTCRQEVYANILSHSILVSSVAARYLTWFNTFCLSMYHVYLPISTFLSLKVNYVFILYMKEQVPPLYFCPGAQRELDSNQFAA